MGLENNKCDRCNEKAESLTGSYFNVQMICKPCDAKEQAHPKFEEAKSAETEECIKGNLNYEGIGLPEDLKQ